MSCPDFEQLSETSWQYIDQGLTIFIKKLRHMYVVEVYSATGKKITEFVDVFTFDEVKLYCQAFAHGWETKENYDKK